MKVFKLDINYEVFSLRDYEKVVIYKYDTGEDDLIAVMLRAVEFPTGKKDHLLAACKKDTTGWYWLNLSPPTKDAIGNLMSTVSAQPERWYYVKVLKNA